MAQDAKVLTLNLGAGDIPTLDPALAEDSTSIQITTMQHFPIIRDTEDNPGNIMPGVAEKRGASEDGLTWTFTVRQGLPWVMWDGSAVVEVKDDAGAVKYVTANDLEYSIKRLLDPRTASPYAYVFIDSLGIVGSGEFNSFTAPEGKDFSDPAVAEELAKLSDAVAVKALDEYTLEVKIAQELSYAESIFSMWNLAAVPQAAIEEHGDKWTEPGNMMSYGPYVASEWKHDESLTMVANPFWPGIENSPKPTITQITFLMLDETPAFNNYEAGTLDATGVPSTELDRVKADPVLSKELLIAPLFCTYVYGFNVTKAPLDNVHMRRALSYAVNRQSIVDNVLKGGQEPARWFSRPGLVAAPTMADSAETGIGYDVDKAKAELELYLKDTGLTADAIPPITFMTNQSEGHIRIAEAIQSMWKETLGVSIEITAQEWQVFLQTRKTDPPQIWRFGWCQDYPDANNFARDVFRSTSSQNDTRWGSEAFDKLVDEAALETDLAKRLDLYRQAENILVLEDAAVIPIYWYTRVGVTKPYVTRTFAVGAGDERYEKWDINK